MDENGVSGNAATRWKRVVEQWRSSGLTVRSFCLRNRLQEGTFFRWKRFFAEKAKTSLVPRPAFLPVVVQSVVSQPAESPIEIELTGRRILRVRSGCDQRLLGDLITLLEGKSC